MTLIVENGTGVAGAESYASLAQATAYWGLRAHDPLAALWTATAAPDAKREGALREASAYIDATYGASYLGGRAGTVQGLLWPRVTVLAVPGARVPLYRHYGISRPYELEYPLAAYMFADTDAADVDLTIVYGADGFALPALPSQIVTATIELAARALQGRLAPDYVSGQRLKSERAGDTENVYFDDGRSPESFGFIAQLLMPILGSAGRPGWAWR